MISLQGWRTDEVEWLEKAQMRTLSGPWGRGLLLNHQHKDAAP